jgi:hypothetical protein
MANCPFKDILGKPGTGLHSIRLFGVAVFDLLLTILLAWFTKNFFGSFWISLIVWFIIGIIVHHIFCVKTTIDKLIFGN